jgi:hypothetical protein
MLKHFILVLSFAGLSFWGHAQDKKQEPLKPLVISFSPGIVPLPGNPLAINPGIEFFFTHRISLLNEIALQTGKNNNHDSTALNKRYFKYKAEARYYFFAQDKDIITTFLGVQFSHANRKFDIGKASEYYDRSQHDSIYAFTRASVSSPVNTLTLQIGGTARIANNFYFELSMGCGLRFINTTYSSLVNPKTIEDQGFINIRPLSSYRYTGKDTRWQLNLGVRVSYRF